MSRLSVFSGRCRTQMFPACVLLSALLSLTAIAFAGSSNNAVPFIDLPLLPRSVKPGAAGFTLTVNGAAFAPGAVVNWNGSPRVTTFISKTQLAAAILASDVVARGTASIPVTNPASGGGTSNVAYFSVTNQEPAVGLGIKGTCSSGPAVTGDFNSDGNVDIGSFDGSLAVINILLGNGDGTFSRRSSYPTGAGPEAVVSADFDKDGFLDLAVITWRNRGLSVYLGNGDGTFRAKGTISTLGGPAGMTVGDFNEDGVPDLVVAGSYWISIYFGNGDGTFQPGATLTSYRGTFVLTDDFNRDGHLDLAFSSGNTVGLMLGNGDGTFRKPGAVSLDGQPGRFVTADFNGDGVPDIALSTTSDNSVSVLLGHGDGTFGAPSTFPIPGPAGVVAVGDLNGDGKLDLVADGSNSTLFTVSTSILIGKGDGTFGPAVSYGPSTWPGWPMFVADLNGDGRLDVNNGCSYLQEPLAITLSQFSLSFPNQTVGTTSSPRKFKITNSGTLAVNIQSFVITGDFSQTNDCPATLDLFQGCIVSVTFTPTSEGGRVGTLSIYDNAAGSPQTVSLSGVGTQ